MHAEAPLSQLAIGSVPLCIVDLETTGLSAGYDRIVEVSVVRLEPDGDARVVLDSLVDPQRRVTGTEIHGITDGHVKGAPTFDQLTPELLEALDGAVLTSYNIYYDLRFLKEELGRTGYQLEVPHICAMYLRPLLGIGSRCALRLACEEHGIEHLGGHSAAGDAVAATELMQHYLEVMNRMALGSFGELRRRGKRYKFLESFDLPPPRYPSAPAIIAKVSRVLEPVSEPDERWRLREYQELVLVLLSDYVVSPQEAEEARVLAARLALTASQVRAVHARIFAATLNQWAADDEIDDNERVYLSVLHRALETLGWAPGG